MGRKAFFVLAVLLALSQVLAAPLHGRVTRSRLPEYEITDEGIFEVYGDDDFRQSDEALVLLTVQESVAAREGDLDSPSVSALIQASTGAKPAAKKKKAKPAKKGKKKLWPNAVVKSASAFNCSCTFIPLTVATPAPSPAKRLAEQRDMDLISKIKHAAEARTHKKKKHALNKKLKAAEKENQSNLVQGGRPTSVPRLPYYPGAPYGKDVAKKIYDYRESRKPKKIKDSLVEASSEASVPAPEPAAEFKRERVFGAEDSNIRTQSLSGEESGNIESDRSSSPIMDGN